jgi:hypothetical protein
VIVGVIVAVGVTVAVGVAVGSWSLEFGDTVTLPKLAST